MIDHLGSSFSQMQEGTRDGEATGSGRPLIPLKVWIRASSFWNHIFWWDMRTGAGKFLEIWWWSLQRRMFRKGRKLTHWDLMPLSPFSKAAIPSQGNVLCHLDTSCNLGRSLGPTCCWKTCSILSIRGDQSMGPTPSRSGWRWLSRVSGSYITFHLLLYP